MTLPAQMSAKEYRAGKKPILHPTKRAKLCVGLPFPPSANELHRPRTAREKDLAAKNGRKLRGQARTERYNTWRNAAGWQLNKHHLHLIPGPFSITIAYGLKNRKRGSDLDNRIKAVLDILQEHQAIENDRLCEGIIAHWDEEVEGCWVNILPTKATSEKWEMAG